MTMMAPDPRILGLLGGGGPRPPGPPQATGPPGDTIEILRRMIDLAKQYIEVEQDPEDKHTMAKVLQTLLQYQADEQKERDTAVGASPAVKYLRRGQP